MAILILYYCVIIPLKNVRRVVSEKEFKDLLACPNNYIDPICFDDYLYKEGSMSPNDNELIIQEWKTKGLVPTEERNGRTYWKDLCLLSIDSPNNPLSYPCEWIEIIERPNDWPNRFANLKGKPITFPEMPKVENKESPSPL